MYAVFTRARTPDALFVEVDCPVAAAVGLTLCGVPVVTKMSEVPLRVLDPTMSSLPPLGALMANPTP